MTANVAHAAYQESPAGVADREFIAGLLTQLGLELGQAIPHARRQRTGVRIVINVSPNMQDADIEVTRRVKLRQG